MEKNLAGKIGFIIAVVLIAIWTLYPPQETLKPGLDLAGGTSLIYQIDSRGLEEADKNGLSERMITILRRRIDPANIQNIVWRPQGDTRFEIQMPLASPESRIRREEYENAINSVLEDNVNPAAILRALKMPTDQRQQAFEKFARGSESRLEQLNELASISDQREQARQQRDELSAKLLSIEEKLKENQTSITRKDATQWSNLGNEQLQQKLSSYNQEVRPLVEEYVRTFAQYNRVTDQLTTPETGLNERYQKSINKLSDFVLTTEQLESILELDSGSARRQEQIEELKEQFPARQEKIDSMVSAFDAYKPLRGNLDDPRDLQRMLKGAGILEFRILPTRGDEISDAQVQSYVTALQEKGPRFASDENFTWVQVESPAEWQNRPDAITASFADKIYVLASNKEDQTMLGTGQGEWKLRSSRPTQDREGKRAIAFSLDDRGGILFGRITSRNMGKPLAIILDDTLISAPNIRARITTDGIIEGSFAKTEQMDMVNKLNAGSLPARLIEQPISVRTIGPAIGADNRDKGIRAGIYGLVAVVVVMLAYYTLAGAIANIALLLNILLVLAIMAFLNATFTLPGIAGIILTIGMSVDANVLIFERIREEQQTGSSLRVAIQNGYQKAFSTIFDANLTTIITAFILYWVASEEIKGFAIVLILGIASSMFTALFVTRVVFNMLSSKGIIKDHLTMANWIGRPNVNWMKFRPIFYTISLLLIISGLAVFFTRDTENNKYDIEFTGGTSVQINLVKDIPISEIRQRLQAVGQQMNNAAIAGANIYSVEKSQRMYEINTTATNKTTTLITFTQETPTLAQIQASLTGQLPDVTISPATEPNSFTVVSSQANPVAVAETLEALFPNAAVAEPAVEEIVNNAILTAFGDDLQVERSLEPEIASVEKIDQQIIDSFPELGNFINGIMVKVDLGQPATYDVIERRFRYLRFKPDLRNLNWYAYEVFTPEFTQQTDPNQELGSFIYVSADPEAAFREITDTQWERFVESETQKVLAAANIESSLPRVTQINPSIGQEAKTRALIAIVLSLFAIIAYIWVRFGDVRYGVAAIVALVHDVSITLGAVVSSVYLASTFFGEALLISDFKINLAVVAAFLTLIGYSLNDTIVVFDRIRENRKKAQLTPKTINDSINQTISRTVMTSFTTFIVIFIMYIFGGQALRAFCFAIGIGIIVGTYSSIAIASPILLIGLKKNKKE